MVGVSYTCGEVDVPEDLTADTDAQRLAEELARAKARAARSLFGPGPLIITADTLVAHAGRILGKPADAEDAVRMLRELSGETHDVVTGVALDAPNETAPRVFSVTSHVAMRELDDDTIRAWTEKGELLGCAGAYNIESHLGDVESDQCFQNVAGLPLCHLYVELARVADVPKGLRSPVGPCDASRGVRCRLGPDVTALAHSR